MQHVADKHNHKTIFRKKSKRPNPYNIGFIDRSLRFIVGGTLLGSFFYLGQSTTVMIFGYEFMLFKVLTLLSTYPLLTAWIGWDPLYQVFNIKSDTSLKEDTCDTIVEQVKSATHMDS